MDSPCSVNTENNYADLCESLYHPTSNFPELLIPPITIYTSSPPLSTTTGLPDSDTSSLVSQYQVPSPPVTCPLQLHPYQGFSVHHVPAPKARVSQGRESNQQGKGKDKETAGHDTSHGGTQSDSPNAPKSPHLHTAFTSYSKGPGHAALDLLATVTSARDDKLQLPIAASDYLDIVRALDVFHNEDNIDGCSPEQKEEVAIEMEQKAEKQWEVEWQLLKLGMVDQSLLFKEVGARLGTGTHNSTWEVLLQDVSWAGIHKHYHNAIHATDPIPATPFVPVPADQL
ncbi:hypothetical protein M404DRAFT_35244 [Pisolithus tinctorius Marx 270]|uniref:Uncharacterized protein n=1 Tax=Pisolithus tinctorius Marx 270 TaxID=870435 RepID=A0A0C3NFI8_PISTI|nr:hypothetical protein M404DRAFT_35244 [Pisolithus tinctorius Marx 270]